MHEHDGKCGCGHDHHDHGECGCKGAHHMPQSFEATLEVASECEDAVVVHGWLHMQGRWVVHAWCEAGEAVYDLTESRAPQPRAGWYASHGVTEERLRRYGRVEFFTRVADTGEFGPYDRELFASLESDVDPLGR
ncbi:hypothetical protein [Nitratidesulfovibrio vulgaris]|jgi:hypothetical protein|uniref:Uncharacterized protein n=1 Tax=Nitratidesulfovibrio vulgaris (strain DP4) TaxID=391774 RepID=A0A0H3ADI3_NITV4|nr:hypothetical protein [Nitratidesulfovibrio vulgaris]ABM29943.1 hypothetical protein Dvul_2932 [Nitratidesulfovibrio vulgaris DP4]ADP85228.1 hypothetical protein Deval_0057 [Nitratidesulfovibrio vulgaris RCH1]WCB46781.1 hypothetical protein PH214_01455 [Nitratidesulfovibrio vulgaris]